MERADFESVFNKQVLSDAEELCKSRSLPDNGREWFLDSLRENTIGGKYNRGIMVIRSYEILTGEKLEPSSPEYTRVALLGWMIELLQAFFLVSDDIMDSSKTRRGKPCHYLRPGVGMIAINDAFMLESMIYSLLKKHFKSHPAYTDLLELFHDITLETEFGQLLDLITAPEDSVNLNNFSMEKYTFIVIYKTAFYSFYLPVALALHYAGKATPSNLKQAHDILIPMGEYFQVQDDYLDGFQDPEILGKIGTDIQDNKCSWLVNQALKLVTPQQREILDKNYGRKDDAAEAEVKKLYKELKLDETYHKYEDRMADELQHQINDVDESEGLKKGVFEAFFKKIYKRQK